MCAVDMYLACLVFTMLADAATGLGMSRPVVVTAAQKDSSNCKGTDVDRTKKCFWNPTHLVYNCSGNTVFDLSCIPSSVLPRIQTLDLSHTNVSKLTEEMFSRMIQLKRLHLEFANITEIESSAFIGLGKLVQLFLTGNKLSKLNYDIFKPMNKLKVLFINNCTLTKMPDQIFNNGQAIESLNISYNNLTQLTRNLLRPLKRLRELNVSGNHLTNISGIRSDTLPALELLSMRNCDFPSHSPLCEASTLTTLLCEASNLTTLDLNGNNIQFQGLFNCNKNIPLKHLDMDNNRQKSNSIEYLTFINLLHLESLQIRNCNALVMHGLMLYGLSNLKFLALSRNKNVQLPRFYYGHGNYKVSMIPKLEILESTDGHLSFNHVKEIDLTGAHNIREVYLKNNCYRYLGLNGNVTHLHTVDISQNPFQLKKNTTFKHLLNLEVLTLTETRYHFKDEDTLMFQPFTELRELNLAGNSFSGIHKDKLPLLFSKLCKLTYLNLASTELYHLHRAWFTCKTSLKELRLEYNHITTWDSDTFNGVPIRTLNVSFNNLKVITMPMLKPLLPHLTKLDVTQNLLECTCKIMPFILWAKSTLEKGLIHRKLELQCTEPRTLASTKLLHYNPPIYQCTYFLVYIPICIVVIFLVILAIIIRKKWLYIKYWFFLIRLRKAKDLQASELAKQYQYDAFVSYSSRDIAWVKLFVNKLEKDYKAKLCMHSRDFHVGRYITENIIEGIEQSRKTIIVLSKNYAKSKWCDFEMDMAHTKQIEESKNFLLLIKLEEIPIKEMSSATLRYLIQHKTYIEWTDENPQVDEIFWRKIAREITIV